MGGNGHHGWTSPGGRGRQVTSPFSSLYGIKPGPPPRAFFCLRFRRGAYSTMPPMKTAVFIRLLALLPLPVSHALAGLIARLLWLFPMQHKDVIHRNLGACLPELSEAERKRLARRVFINEAKTVMESPRFWYGPERVFDRSIREIENGHLVDEALARGKGLLLLTMHTGSWEATAMCFSRDYAITGMYKPQKGSAEDVIYKGRTRFKVTLEPTIPGVVGKKIIPVLENNGIVALMPDQDPPLGSGTFAPFFGVTAHTPVFVPRMVQKTGAAVLFFYGYRLPWGRGFSMHFYEPPAAVYDPDIDTAVTALNEAVEYCVRKQPEQYWWGYERFRRRPEGEPPFYKHEQVKDEQSGDSP